MKNYYNIINSQFGNGNTMYNAYEPKTEVLQEKHWDELIIFLSKRLNELEHDSESYKIADSALEYSKQRNETGLKNFVNSNKEAFFTNVLSDIASSGLLYVLSKLFI